MSDNPGLMFLGWWMDHVFIYVMCVLMVLLTSVFGFGLVGGIGYGLLAGARKLLSLDPVMAISSRLIHKQKKLIEAQAEEIDQLEQQFRELEAKSKR